VSQWRVFFARRAVKDAALISAAGLKPKVESLLALLAEDPYTSPPSFKPLRGDLAGAYSRRITLQHRLVYEVDDRARVVKILRMWSHYE
jgi:toxin YoeB